MKLKDTKFDSFKPLQLHAVHGDMISSLIFQVPTSHGKRQG